MKKLIVSLLMVAGASATLAQGSITFNTFNGGNTNQGQTFLFGRAPGPDIVAELWWGFIQGGSYTPMNALATGQPLPQQFFPGSTYIQDGSYTIPGHIGGEVVFVEMRVWNLSAGPTWAAAGGDTPGSNPALYAFGKTAQISRTLGGVDIDGHIVLPQQFNTFNNLRIGPIPEPSIVALAGLGLASLLIFRRRK